MEIKGKCRFDIDSMKALIHLSMFKKNDPKKTMLSWVITFAVLLAVLLLEMIFLGGDASLYVLMALCIIMILLVCFCYYGLPIISYNSLAKLKEAENEYTFTDDCVQVVTKSSHFSGEAKIEYSLFVKVYETSKYLFLYQTNNQVYIVNKAFIEGGSCEEISDKLRSTLGKKYLVCKY